MLINQKDIALLIDIRSLNTLFALETVIRRQAPISFSPEVRISTYLPNPTTMSTESTQDWEHGEKSGLVSIGTHKLYLEVSGPDRKPGEPIVVLMQGLGASLKEWTVVKNQVSKFSRYLQYDRTGLGQSESPPELPRAISAASVASDLDTLRNLLPPQA